jgi:hypothetical protein
MPPQYSLTEPTAVSNEQMVKQSRRLMEETVKHSDRAYRFFWLTIILGTFALLRYLAMVVDFFAGS